MEKQNEPNPQEKVRQSMKDLLQDHGLDAVVDALVRAAGGSDTTVLDLVTSLLSTHDPSLREEDRSLEPKEKLGKCISVLKRQALATALGKSSSDKILDISET
jgi:hypothetical protein